jgi:hypothetical protein
MLGLVIRVVEAQISLSLDVMRKGAEFAGRLTGWAFNEVAGGLAPDRTQSTASRPAPEPPPVPEPVVPSAAVQTEPLPEPSPPSTEPVVPSAAVQTEPLPEAEPPADISGGEGAAVVEHEPGPGTSVRARTPHSALNNPVTEPDLTEWPDPYDQREDPRDPGEEMVFGGDAGHTPPGAISTSEPHPSQDPEAEPAEGPKRDKVDR